jgi:hypothetical protein
MSAMEHSQSLYHIEASWRRMEVYLWQVIWSVDKAVSQQRLCINIAKDRRMTQQVISAVVTNGDTNRCLSLVGWDEIAQRQESIEQ